MSANSRFFLAEPLTPHGMIQSFVTGLSDFLTTLAPPSLATRKTRPLAFVSGAAAATFTWKADVDYFYTGTYSSSGAETQVTTSGKALIPLATKADFTQGDVLHLTTTTTASSVPVQHTFIPKDTTITVQIGAASSVAIVVLEYA
jgi:hypothetical protein